jgi:hypothetical protein
VTFVLQSLILRKRQKKETGSRQKETKKKKSREKTELFTD